LVTIEASLPVMPWTTILEFSSNKMAIYRPSPG
jgi:hypothetical protein